MSSDALPITPARFAEALTSLPLGNLHLKAAELRNSISHLQSSNIQLKPYADEGDRDCADAIAENVEVIQRMEERIELVKQEVEGRGFKWDEAADVAEGREESNGQLANGYANGNEPLGEGGEEEEEVSRTAPDEGVRGPRLTDEELVRRLREQMAEDMEDQDGVHL
jgi:hypothetical protein